MRIVSGAFKGRRFSPPKSFRARPTTDFAKESLFNIISNHFDFEEICVLDLFAGTGSISFEFASRGCRNVHLVERSRAHLDFARGVIAQLQLEGVTPILGDAFRFLQSCRMAFDLIFADPPFDMPGIERLPGLVFERGLLQPDGWLIVEHSGGLDFSQTPHFWQLRNYGRVHFSFFR